MREQEKAALSDCSTEDGSGQMSLTGIIRPIQDYITAFTPEQGTIASILRRGRDNPTTCREISRITGLEQRQITKTIQRERQSGAPILSSPSGYWIAENEDELTRCIRALHARAEEIHRTARALERLEEWQIDRDS